jgi:hypothetical protein
MAIAQNSKNNSLIDDYTASAGSIEHLHAGFDQKEKILLSKPQGKIDREETKSKIVDPTLLSAVIKQNNSIVAQMPSGKVTALTKENKGKSLFMDLILNNHVIPNATSQYDVFTKLWMLSFYRKVYGSMGVLVDYVTGGGYGKNNAGPDFTILPIRSIVPQVGKYTEADCEYIYVRSRLTKKWLESRKKDDKWKNVDKVLEKKGDFSIDLNSSSFVERDTENAMAKRDEYEIITRYEPDKWTTFHAGSKEIIREIENPQKNDQIPVIMCHAYPLIDRFIGLGDFERGIDLHTSLSSLVNLYMDGMKAGIFPNLKIDPAAVENWSEIKKHGLSVGQVWLMKQGKFDGIEQMKVTPDLSVFQSTFQFLKGAILTLTNTSDTSLSEATDPGFGKTPQALKMQAMNQGAQTQFDRRMLEISTEKIFDRMIDLVAKKQNKQMNLYLQEADLKAVADVAPDVVEMFEVGQMGSVTIKPSEISNCEYRYTIDHGSTVKKDEIMENQTLTEILGLVMKIPGAMESLANGGLIPLGDKNLNLGELLKQWIITSGTTNADKIITDNEQAQAGVADPNMPQDPNMVDPAMNMEDPQAMEAMNGAFASSFQQAPEMEFEDPRIAEAFNELKGL